MAVLRRWVIALGLGAIVLVTAFIAAAAFMLFLWFGALPAAS